MKDTNISKEHLERRRDEINAQLGDVSKDERIELDPDMEEQAIQMEQHEVSVAIVDNLRRELADIEERLARLES
jgi:RNA polymerase-binding transcription factor DksA